MTAEAREENQRFSHWDFYPDFPKGGKANDAETNTQALALVALICPLTVMSGAFAAFSRLQLILIHG